MKKWIFLLLFNQFCLGGEPPFSDLQRKPSLSPYLRLDESLNLRYNQEVGPFLEQQRLNQSNVQKKSFNNFEPRKEFCYPSNGIRPTGHPTHFMHIPYYNFR